MIYFLPPQLKIRLIIPGAAFASAAFSFVISEGFVTSIAACVMSWRARSLLSLGSIVDNFSWVIFSFAISSFFEEGIRQCGEAMKIIAYITNATSIHKILTHIGENSEQPKMQPARPYLMSAVMKKAMFQYPMNSMIKQYVGKLEPRAVIANQKVVT
ncbi:MAG: hypothetical protein M3R00_10475 [Pseudomonadota bacterium]|nr:hypothetical protein [Pseudomonadota bacterium]